MTRRLLFVLLSSVIAVVAAPVAAGDGGPAPGVITGGTGIAARDGRVHYVAVPSADGTVVEAIDRHGSVLRSNWLIGNLGVPLVAIDGTPGGLSRDGKRLVLASYAGPDFTRFTVVGTKQLVAVRNITLNGYWSYDALSPDARTLYLIQYFVKQSSQRYLVRAYDLARGRLYRRAIVARTETGTMTGYPVTRATGRDGAWAYTLYVKANGSAFVHALNTVHRKAVCIDLPWKEAASWIYDARLWLSPDGSKLHLGQRGTGGRRAVVDTRTWAVSV